MDAFSAVQNMEKPNTFEGDALNYLLEAYENIFENAREGDDVEDEVFQFLEDTAEVHLPVYNLLEDDMYPYIEENVQAEQMVKNALARRMEEGKPVDKAAFAVVTQEGHVLLISLDMPKTSTVVRSAL